MSRAALEAVARESFELACAATCTRGGAPDRERRAAGGVALATSSVDIIVEPLARTSASRRACHALEFEDGICTGRVAGRPMFRAEKKGGPRVHRGGGGDPRELRLLFRQHLRPAAARVGGAPRCREPRFPPAADRARRGWPIIDSISPCATRRIAPPSSRRSSAPSASTPSTVPSSRSRADRLHPHAPSRAREAPLDLGTPGAVAEHLCRRASTTGQSASGCISRPVRQEQGARAVGDFGGERALHAVHADPDQEHAAARFAQDAGHFPARQSRSLGHLMRGPGPSPPPRRGHRETHAQGELGQAGTRSSSRAGRPSRAGSPRRGDSHRLPCALPLPFLVASHHRRCRRAAPGGRARGIVHRGARPLPQSPRRPARGRDRLRLSSVH